MEEAEAGHAGHELTLLSPDLGLGLEEMGTGWLDAVEERAARKAEGLKGVVGEERGDEMIKLGWEGEYACHDDRKLLKLARL